MVTDEKDTEKCEEVRKAYVGKKHNAITNEVERDVGNKSMENLDAAHKNDIPNDEERSAVEEEVQSDVNDKSIENLDAEGNKEKGDVGKSMETKENNKEPDVNSSKQHAVQEQEDKRDVGNEKCDIINKEKPEPPDHSVLQVSRKACKIVDKVPPTKEIRTNTVAILYKNSSKRTTNTRVQMLARSWMFLKMMKVISLNTIQILPSKLIQVHQTPQTQIVMLGPVITPLPRNPCGM